MKFNNIDVNDVYFNNKEVMKIYLNSVLVFEKSSGDWQLSQDKFIIGEDGKYYEYLFIGEVAPPKGSVDLNNEWVEDIISTNISDDYDYFMSNSNYHKANGYSQFMVEWSGLTHIDIQYRSKAESNYDYIVINGLDKNKFTSNPSYTTSGILAHTRGKQTDTFNTLSLDCDENTHHIWFCYRKDSSGDTEPDRAFVGIPKSITQGSIIEIDHKKGAELRYEYIKSAEFDFVDETHIHYKYYKTYYTPNGEPHQTSDFIYGEIEEVHPLDINDYCRFTTLDNQSDFSYLVTGGLSMGDVYYNLTGFKENDVLWDGSAVTVPANSSIFIRNAGNGGSLNNTVYYTFKSTNFFKIDGGNIGNLKNANSTYTYKSMFYNANKLVSVSDECMPNEPLKSYCYSSMFQNCTSLVEAPELPATTLTLGCYSFMFYACTALTTAPELPATTLKDFCYNSMFQSCTKLTQAPALPATTLASYCYQYMFNDCTSLEQAPELPATTLANNCYYRMFYSCKSLNYIKADFLTEPSSTYTNNWVSGVASSGTFVKNPEAEWDVIGTNGVPTGWTIIYPEPKPIDINNYCQFTTLDNQSDFGYTVRGDLTMGDVYYNLTGLEGDDVLWDGSAVTVPANSSIYIRNVGNGGTQSSSNYYRFTSTDQFKIDGGNISNLKNADGDYTYYKMFKDTYLYRVYDECMPNEPLKLYCYSYMFSGCTKLTQAPALTNTTLAYYCYVGMFQNCTSLVEAPELPATTLTLGCYGYMFDACTALTTAPTLPATKLSDSCYQFMFQNCTSLVEAPELPATELIDYCYDDMFNGCTALTTAPELPATTLKLGCYYSMFNGCTALTTAPELPATILAVDCYNSMFYGCTALTQAPTLPATTLASYCYSNMFYGCTALTQAPELPATELKSYCYRGMFQGCTALTTAPELPATILAVDCYNSMFYGCTALTQAPELPATTLVSNCYYRMFYSCRSINYIKADFLTEPSSTYTNNWVSGVASSGTFVKNPNATWDVIGANGVPEGWTIVYPEPRPIDINNYCRFTTSNNPVNFSYTVSGGLSMGDVYYNLTGYEGDDVLWDGSVVTVPANSSIYIRNVGNGGTQSSSAYYKFNSSNSFGINGGNISNLKNADGDYTYYMMFKNTHITEVSNECMPNEPLKPYCYAEMFSDCDSLALSPALSATTLADYCYYDMFYNCDSLVVAPQLPATELVVGCYGGMFSGCTSLKQAPALPATTLAGSCYSNMFSGCTSLKQAPELPAITLAGSCYQFMFRRCTSLTQAPELPATRLTYFCYQYMFQGCSNLNYIKADFLTKPSNNYTNNWVSGVASSGTFVKNPNATWDVIGNNGVPEGWTIVNS